MTDRYAIVGNWNERKPLRVYGIVGESAEWYETDGSFRGTGRPIQIQKKKCCGLARSREAALQVTALHRQLHEAVTVLLDGYRSKARRFLEDAAPPGGGRSPSP